MPLAAYNPSCWVTSQSPVSCADSESLALWTAQRGQWGKLEGAVSGDTETDTGPFPRQVLPSAGKELASPALLGHCTKIPNHPGHEGQKLPQTPSSRSSQTEAAQRGDRDGLRSHSVLRAEAGLELSRCSLYLEVQGQWCLGYGVPLFPRWGSRAHTLSEKPPEPLRPCLCWLTVPSQPRLRRRHGNSRGPGEWRKWV